MALAVALGLLPGRAGPHRSGAESGLAPGDLGHGGFAAPPWCDPVKEQVGKEYAYGNHGEKEIDRFAACLPDRIVPTGTYGCAAVSVAAEPVGFVGGSSGTRGPKPSATLRLPAPSGTVPGDVLLAVIGSGYGHIESPPSGWVQVRQDLKMRPRDDLAIQSYVKVVSAQDPAGWEWPLVAAGGPATKGLAAGSVMAFRGVDRARRVFSSGVRAQTPDRKRIECPTVDAPAGGMLVCAYVTDDPNRIAVPEDMTLVAHLTTRGDDTYAVAYERRHAPGPTGVRTARLDGVDGGATTSRMPWFWLRRTRVNAHSPCHAGRLTP